MSFATCLQYMRDAFRTAPELEFVEDQYVIIGDRKHGHELATYEIQIVPAMKHRDKITFAKAAHRRAEESRFYRIHITLWIRHPDVEDRILGNAERGLVGMFEFEDRVVSAWERACADKTMPFARTFVNTTHEATEYVETFPPPCVKMVIMTEEACFTDQIGEDGPGRGIDVSKLPKFPAPWTPLPPGVTDGP